MTVETRYKLYMNEYEAAARLHEKQVEECLEELVQCPKCDIAMAPVANLCPCCQIPEFK